MWVCIGEECKGYGTKLWFWGNLKLIPDDVTGEENRQPSNNVQQENFLMVSKVGFELVQRQKRVQNICGKQHLEVYVPRE